MVDDEESGLAISANLLIDEDDAFVVYLDEETLDVRFELLDDTEISLDVRAFLSRGKLMGSAPTAFLTSGVRLTFKRMIGEAIALALRGNLPAGEALLAEAQALLQERAGERARIWYVQAILTLLVLLCLGFFVPGTIWKIEKDILPGNLTGAANDETRQKLARIHEDRIYTAKLYGLAIVGGALGAGFSLLVRVGNLKIDPNSGQTAHYGEVLYRMTIGGFAAVILVIGLEANVFAGFLDVASEDGLIDAELYAKSFWTLCIFSITAGASERMVPSLLRQLSDRTVKEGESNPAESPTP